MGQTDYKKLRLANTQLFSKMRLMNIFPGDWRSIYKGDGIEFDSTKPFQPGDNPKDLDLLVLVQSGEQDIVLRAEDRQIKIYICIDLSGSMSNCGEMFFPSKANIKDIAIGLISYSSCNMYTPLGLCAFDSGIRKYFPARSGIEYCDQIIQWIIEHDCEENIVSMDIEKAVSFITERICSQDMLFFISDFHGNEFESDFTNLIKPLVDKFDFIPVIIRDPLEKKTCLKKTIRVVLENSEGNGDVEVCLSPRKFQEIQAVSEKHYLNLRKNFYQLGAEYIVLDSPSIDYCYHIFSSFFDNRKRIGK